MSTLAKIIVSILFFIVYLVITTLIIGIAIDNGSKTGGIIPAILLVGLIAAIRAVWKAKPTNYTDNDNINLDKS